MFWYLFTLSITCTAPLASSDLSVLSFCVIDSFISYKWGRTCGVCLYFCGWLISHNIMFFCPFHVAEDDRIPSFLMCICATFYQFIHQLMSLFILVLGSCNDMDVQASPWYNDLISFGHSEIARLYVNSVSSFLTIINTLSHNGCNSFHSYQQCVECLFLSIF
jgi:hypothetical protein